MHLFYFPIWLDIAPICLVALLALWCGDRWTRAISIWQVIWLANWWFGLTLCHGWQCLGPTPHWVVRWLWLAWDLITLAICLAGVWRVQRYWILCAASFTLLLLASRALGTFLPGVSQWAYLSADLVWFFGLSASVLVGLWPEARMRLRAALAGPR